MVEGCEGWKTWVWVVCWGLVEGRSQAISQCKEGLRSDVVTSAWPMVDHVSIGRASLEETPTRGGDVVGYLKFEWCVAYTFSSPLLLQMSAIFCN